MSKLEWDQTGSRTYETGVEKGVLFPFKSGAYQKGVAWNGLTGVSENPSGAENNALYADNIKYLNLQSAEEFGATIEAYTYPDEFTECDGSAEIVPGVVIGQQKRIPFGMSYVTKFGNDVDGTDYGYKIHIVYGAQASPSEKGYTTINDSPDAITFSWEVTTTPVKISGFKPTACITINSTKVSEEDLKTLEDMLYGTETTEPTLPMPSDLVDIFGPIPPETYPDFSWTETYSLGDKVKYQDVMVYECILAGVAQVPPTGTTDDNSQWKYIKTLDE